MINKIKKWWRIWIQCKVTVLDILQYADKHRREGLCWSFDDACYHYGVRTSDFKDKCTQFSNDNAYEFGAKAGDWWWRKGTWGTGREKFLHYLIDYYSKHEPVYLENI